MNESKATLLYRCRMCEQVINIGYKDAEKVRNQFSSLLENETVGQENVNKATRQIAHYHYNEGTIGFADLIGMKFQEDSI